MCQDDWDVTTPREFQIQSIHRGAYYDNSFLSVTAKTGYGKSLIALGVATMRRGVTIIQVPLLGLGTDQVAKATHIDRNIEAYHVDEFKGKDGTTLRNRLVHATDEELQKLSLILFMSPQSLLPESDWSTILQRLATKGHISTMVVDEAHQVQLHGEGYRPAFVGSLMFMRTLYESMPALNVGRHR